MPVTLLEQCHGGGELWFPGLAADLVARFQAQNASRPVLPDVYSTYRWLVEDAAAHTKTVATCALGAHTAAVELLPVDVAPFFIPLELSDVGPCGATDLQAASGVLSAVDGLADTVGMLVRAIHPLAAPAGYDVSYSSPNIPFSIFVSLPGDVETDRTLRLAEAILHESMHLQLTLIEQIEPLVTRGTFQASSPWKSEPRPVSGLLHGLYVFAVIHQVFGLLRRIRPEAAAYGRRRQSKIAEEVATLPEHPRGLSEFGAELWERCRQNVLVQAHMTPNRVAVDGQRP